MNASDKAKYQKAKYVVKKWENEFKKSTGQVPTKVDIKGASSKIKDAYRTYWHLKTLTLENSLLDITLDENAKDAFNLSLVAGSESQKDLSQTFKADDSQCYKSISDVTSDLTCDSQAQSCHSLANAIGGKTRENHLNNSGCSQNDVTKELSLNKNNLSLQNLKTVWGEHLTKKPEDKPKPQAHIKSVSSIYAEKLFQGSKFNKRNPRKPRKFDKPKPKVGPENPPAGSGTNDDMKQPNDEISHPKPVQIFIPDDKNCEETSTDGPNFNILNEKLKVVIKSTPQNAYHGVNILQKTISESVNSKSVTDRRINQGWLNRLSDANQQDSEKERCSFDSGIDVKDVSSSKGDSFTDVSAEKVKSQSKNEQSEDSGEDLIYDSDTESQATSQSLFNLSSKNSFTGRIFNNISHPDRAGLKRQLEDPEVVTNPTKVRKILPENGPTSLSREASFSIADAPPKSATDKKLELLEKKLLSGKANENFVRINIQKKVYARGKKRTTYSNFKKQQWKSLKKKSGGSSSFGGGGDLDKCFKCGDVGHFANKCRQKAQKKEDVDVYEFEEDSPLPTLEEAETMAREASEKVHARKKLRTMNTQITQNHENENTPMPVIFEQHSPINSFFSTNPDGSLIETPELVYEALREFGHTEFRVGQEKAIMRILSGMSTLVTLSTGTGKSLCYQLPAYIYSKYKNCITLVVSPLVSLMEDQVFCGATCLKVACLHTNMTPKQRESVMERLKDGSLSVLLVSPEALASGDRMASSFLRHLPPIAFACIDEAHCVSQWSHNFRPSYLTICQVLREKLGVKTILGLTATATVSTVRSILEQFGVPKNDPDSLISEVPIPDNLSLSVSMDEDKNCAILSLLASERFANCSSIVVYCTRREQCDKLAVLLRTSLQTGLDNGKSGRLSLHAEAYHAGLSAARRKQVQKHFMTGKLRIVVATVAFGMGINKNDIRAIIHYNMPSSFESYVQEVGRAGRDKLEAHCHTFLDRMGGDLAELKRHVYSNTVDRHTIRKLLQMVFEPCKCEGTCAKHEVAFPIDATVTALDMPQENIQTLLCYLELHETKWIQTLPPAYTKCKISSYKGDRTMKQAAKTCPPLAMALATLATGNQSVSKLEFDIIKLARAMNWDSGVVKYTLKNLEWITGDDGPRKSGIAVEFSVLGFRILSTGNLTEDQLDSALDILHSNVLNHERLSLYQVHKTYDTLKRSSHQTINECSEKIDVEKAEQLKATIRNYFSTEEDTDGGVENQVQLENEDCIIRDIRNMISMYSDRSFNGRNIARIFHGIASPNFPPIVWGRTRFWRAHLDQDFNLLCKLATKQLILMR